MTDRELIELAAKAAGYNTNHPWNADRMKLDPPVIDLVVQKNGELVNTGWNPLTDPGAALRLAVMLNIRFAGEWGGQCIALFGIHEYAEPSVQDPMAAICLAIVRAAAEIGKAME